jgi:hypothetical protein
MTGSGVGHHPRLHPQRRGDCRRARCCRRRFLVVGSFFLLVVDSFLFGGSPKTPALDESVLQVGPLLFSLTGAPRLLRVWRDQASQTALPVLAFPVVILSPIGLAAALPRVAPS